MKRLLLVLLLFILSCAPKYPQPVSPTRLFELKTVYVDNRFTDQERNIIQHATLAWTIATKDMIIYDIKYADLFIYDNEFDSMSLKDTRVVITPQHHGSNRIMIIRTNSSRRFTSNAQDIVNAAIEKTSDKYKILSGIEFDWKGYGVIALVVDKIKDDKVFEATVLHELSHQIYANDHIDDKNKPSIMTAAPENSSGCITRLDMEEFCNIYMCKWWELNYCIK